MAPKTDSETPAKRKVTSSEKPADEKADKRSKGVVEEGKIVFMYKPKVAVEHPKGIDDVQRFSMLLSPNREGAKHRLIIVGKKQLPSITKHDRFFGFVAKTSDRVEDLTSGLGQSEHETKTKGTRVQGAARVAGEGMYEIVDRDGASTNLAYKLEVPEEPGQVQKELNIGQEGSFKISVKNTNTENPPNAGLKDKADFSKEQQQEFKGKRTSGLRWIGVQDPTLLDKERAELLLIGATDDLKGELGDAGKHLEELAEADKEHAQEEYGDDDEHEALMQALREDVKADLPMDAADKGTFQ